VPTLPAYASQQPSYSSGSSSSGSSSSGYGGSSSSGSGGYGGSSSSGGGGFGGSSSSGSGGYGGSSSGGGAYEPAAGFDDFPAFPMPEFPSLEPDFDQSAFENFGGKICFF
jgi:hypothetical protein